MPFLDKLIEVNNQQLIAGPLSDSRFQSGRIMGIANEALRDGKMIPVIMNRDYEAQDIAVVDDTYPIQIYHKVLAKRYGTSRPGEYGDRNKYVTETVLVKMVVYGKFSKLQVTKEQLEAIITTNFPDNMDNQGNALLNSLGLTNVTYEMDSVNYSSKSVWDEEYRGNEFRLAPEDIFFSINYKINSSWRKGCFQLCNCN